MRQEVLKMLMVLKTQKCNNIHSKYNFQQLFQNHECRIGKLEGTVEQHGKILINHEYRIAKLENTVNLHSQQFANHENRIGKLEGIVKMNGKILASHE